MSVKEVLRITFCPPSHPPFELGEYGDIDLAGYLGAILGGTIAGGALKGDFFLVVVIVVAAFYGGRAAAVLGRERFGQVLLTASRYIHEHFTLTCALLFVLGTAYAISAGRLMLAGISILPLAAATPFVARKRAGWQRQVLVTTPTFLSVIELAAFLYTLKAAYVFFAVLCAVFAVLVIKGPATPARSL